MNVKALGAELVGTFVLVFAGVGAAMFAGPSAGLLAPAFAFGLAVLVMAYAVGHISGGHFNPAVTVGLIAGGRFGAGNAVGYIVAQVVGGVLAVLVLAMVLGGASPGGKWNTFAAVSNTYGGKGGFGMLSAAIMEVVVTAIFVMVIMGATSKRAPAGFAPIAIGLALTLLHLVSIPVTNASINPARSTAPALLAGGAVLSQLWLFWVAPIVGGALGGVVARWLQDE